MSSSEKTCLKPGTIPGALFLFSTVCTVLVVYVSDWWHSYMFLGQETAAMRRRNRARGAELISQV